MDSESDEDAAPRPFIGPFGGQQDWVTRGELLEQPKDIWNQPDLLLDFANRFHDHIRSKKSFSLLDHKRKTDIMVTNDILSGYIRKTAPTVISVSEQTQGDCPPDWSRALRAFQNGRLHANGNDDNSCHYKGFIGPFQVGIFENEVRAFRRFSNKPLPSGDDWLFEQQCRRATKLDIDSALLHVTEGENFPPQNLIDSSD
jgi:hypothetical protein